MSRGDEPRFLGNGSSLEVPAGVGMFLESPTRLKISLSGEWNLKIGGEEKGRVSIPSAYDFPGKVEFQRFFALQADQIDRYRFQLVVLGSNYRTDVTVNGEYLTHHQGGYTSFVTALPKILLHPGNENTIQIGVDNELDAKTSIPLRQQVWGWRNYGGIHRDVYLLATPNLYVKDASYTSVVSSDHQSARIISEARIDGGLAGVAQSDTEVTAGLTARCELVDRVSGAVVAMSESASLIREGSSWKPVLREMVVQQPRLWSMETPNLYLLKWFISSRSGAVDSVIDEYRVTCGIRQLEIQNANLQLNGKRLILKGVMWYEDHPQWGSAISYADREKDVAMIKNLGANVIRFANHPPHPFMLDLCDRYGVLAMVEIPLSTAPASVLLDPVYQELAQEMTREMVLRDRTHPSVIAWGIGSAFETSDPGVRPFVESLVGTVHSLDRRFTYLASRMPTTDTCSDLVDLAALEVHVKDQKLIKPLLEQWRGRHRGQPVIVSRLGTEVQDNNRKGYTDPLSQQAQARFFLQRLEDVRALDYDGVLICSFNDWIGDRPSLTAQVDNPWLCSMGLVNTMREKRLAYDIVRAVFLGQKVAALPAGTYSGGVPVIYVLAGFVALIALAYLYNANRRFRDTLNRSVLSSYNFFADVRDHHVVTIWHTTILGLLVSVATSLVLSGILYHYRSDTFVDHLLTYLLITDSVKAAVVRLIWNPLNFILVFTGLTFAIFVLTSGFIHLLRVPAKASLYAIQAYTTSIWSASPLVALIPIGMIIYRIMQSQLYVVPALFVVGLFLLWVFSRHLKGIAIVYDIFPLKVYVIGTLVLVCLLGVIFAYYDVVYGVTDQLAFLYKIR